MSGIDVATDDEFSDFDATSINPVAKSELTSELTIQMPAIDVADYDKFSDLDDDAAISEELTAELPAADNDETVEMEIDSGRTSSKK